MNSENYIFEVKDWLLGNGPLRSITKCCKCDKGAVWEPKEPDLPFYCEDHAPWRNDNPYENYSNFNKN